MVINAVLVGRIFVLLISGVGIRAYRDLSRPEAWAYWKESYLAPTMTSALIPSGRFRRLGPWPARARHQRGDRRRHRELVPGQAREGHLAAGDAVLLSSPGGDLNRAVIMGEIIRSRGLVTAVGVTDASGQVRQPIVSAPACSSMPAARYGYGMEGSMLGSTSLRQ